MADIPDPEPPGPLARREPPGADFCDDPDDWGLDLDREPPSEEELHGAGFDPHNSPVEGWEVMSDAQRAELAGGDLYPDQDGDEVVPEALEAGFTHRRGGTGTGAGFAAGGPLDVLLPGPDLAWHAGAARQRGLDALSDDELIGVLARARRLGSWSAELELAVVAELDARRAGPDGRQGEHVTEELAAALTLTGRSAGSLLELSRRLERLPQTTALLAAGVIDRSRAAVIADQLSLLDDDAAAAVEDQIARRAGAMTTGRLAAACQRAVLASDPQAAARRREKAEKKARVQCWAEPAGTGAIAGRDLNLAGVIAADRYLDAAARWLQRRGAPGSIDQLRARASWPAWPASPSTPCSPTPPRAHAARTRSRPPAPPAQTRPTRTPPPPAPRPTPVPPHPPVPAAGQTAGYRPPDSLRHLIKTRSPRCGYPGCRRPATGCDDDHTIPHHHGGRTCECNLALAYIS